MRLKPGTKKKQQELAQKIVGKVTEWTDRPTKKKPQKKTKTTTTITETRTETEPATEPVSIMEEFTRLPEESKIETSHIIHPVIPTPEEISKTATERLEELTRQKPVIEQLTEAVRIEPEPAPAPPTTTSTAPETETKTETSQETVTVTETEQKSEEDDGIEVGITDNKYGLKGTDLKMSDGTPYRPKIRVGKGKIIAEMYFLIGDMPYLITELVLKVSRHPMRNMAWPVGATINALLPESRTTTFNWRGATFELDSNKVYRVSPRGFHAWYWIQLMEPRDVFPVDPSQKPRHQPIVMGTSGTSTVVSHLIMGSRVIEKFADKLSQMNENQQSFTLPVVILLIAFALIAGIFMGMWIQGSHLIKDVVSPHTPVFTLIKSLIGM